MADFGANPAPGPHVIMVHGGFGGGWCFDQFRQPFEAAGYIVHAPDLPGHAVGDGAVRGRSMRDYARAITAEIGACATPPVLIGHSMGGLVAQLAAAQAPVAGLVLLAPSPPWGMPVTSAVEAAASLGLYAHGPFWLEAIKPEWTLCRSYTLDRMPEDEARAIYARMVPESGLALFETLNWWMDFTAATSVPAAGVRAPVLALTGEHDQIHPPATVASVAARYGGTAKTVPGMSHWTLSGPGWEGVAKTALDWVEEVTGVGTAVARVAV